RGCCGSTGPGSTSSGAASSCCSATMTDARSTDRCLPATLAPATSSLPATLSGHHVSRLGIVVSILVLLVQARQINSLVYI
uniref:Uncharacterized protein n=1 Tax=Aegilops tauschii subsp. strangulata TaxID=200361 RepID=A0A452ZRM1_AEGTS